MSARLCQYIPSFVCHSVIALSIAVITATAGPSTTAPQDVVEVHLEDPLTRESQCYFDLDDSKTFTFDESGPADFHRAQRRIRDEGSDLMCEPRPPAEGLVVYGIAMVPTNEGIDASRDYATVRDRVTAAEAKP